MAIASPAAGRPDTLTGKQRPATLVHICVTPSDGVTMIGQSEKKRLRAERRERQSVAAHGHVAVDNGLDPGQH